MAVSIETSLTVTNETAIRGQAMADLIADKIGYLKKVYFGHRPIGAEDPQIQFPCAMVEPVNQAAEMYTTGKYSLTWTYHIYYYVLEDNRDDLLIKQSEVMETLCKLFSNNALTDMGAGNTNKYKAYPPYWLTSEIRNMEYSSTFAWARNDRPKFCRAGLMVLEIQDFILK